MTLHEQQVLAALQLRMRGWSEPAVRVAYWLWQDGPPLWSRYVEALRDPAWTGTDRGGAAIMCDQAAEAEPPPPIPEKGTP